MLLSVAGIAGGGGGCGGTAAEPKLTVLNFPAFSVAYSLALDRIVILRAPTEYPAGPHSV